MAFKNGKKFTVRLLTTKHKLWKDVEAAVLRRTKPGTGAIILEELWDVRWRKKPFPYSYYKKFRPNRRFFFHGTSKKSIQKILNGGFKIVSPKHGNLLGSGIYATYHTQKGKMYGTDNYVISVMVYAPNTYLVQPNQIINQTSFDSIRKKYDAIEVRTNSIACGWIMRNHELCVFDTCRIIPRFILKLG